MSSKRRRRKTTKKEELETKSEIMPEPEPTPESEKVIMKVRDAEWICVYNNCITHIEALKEKGVKDPPSVSRKMSKKQLLNVFYEMHHFPNGREGKFSKHFR